VNRCEENSNSEAEILSTLVSDVQKIVKTIKNIHRREVVCISKQSG